MKRLVIGIFSAFFLLLGVSVYIAQRTYDGTVEENYYQRSLEYFHGGERGTVRAASMPFIAVAEGQKILLDIAPKPLKAMRELTFSVEVPGYCGAGSPWSTWAWPGCAWPRTASNSRRQATGAIAGRGSW